MILGRRNRKQYLRKREEARILVHARIRHWNGSDAFKVRKVFIKNHKSRWGSCSQKGNLNFNYKIVYLPLEIADYIIVHELCHLVELNHSDRFWQLVELALPQYKLLRTRLRALERGAA